LLHAASKTSREFRDHFVRQTIHVGRNGSHLHVFDELAAEGCDIKKPTMRINGIFYMIYVILTNTISI